MQDSVQPLFLVGHYSDNFYTHLMRVTSSKETLHANKAYERLSDTCGTIVYEYKVDNGRFFRDLVQREIPDLWVIDNLLWGGIFPPKRDCLT